MDTVRWGIVGTGGIAAHFVTDLGLLDGPSVVAVGSRTAASAARFAGQHGIGRAYPSYAELVADPEVDVVYVATPHPGHLDAALLAIEAGKAVLVEKPFAMNADQARLMVEAARTRGVFLMEAMWTRFLPHIVALRELLADGALGDVRTIVADHGQWFPRDASHRLFAPELGGGALLDLGIYPVSFASMVLGSPASVSAVSDRAFTGVDAQTSMVLRDGDGRHAVLTTTLSAATGNTAVVSGSDARVEIDRVWYSPSSFTLLPRVGDPVRHDFAHEGNGLRHQAAEVARCIAAGLPESPVMPLDETVSIMATLDEVRRQIGLAYAVAGEPGGI